MSDPVVPRPRPRRAAAPAALALPLLLLTGCAHGYAADRAADALDIFTLQGSVGLGVSVDAKATAALHVGAGYAQGVAQRGLRGREPVSLLDREIGLPASLLLWVGALRDGTLVQLGQLHARGQQLLEEDPWRAADVEVGFVALLGLRFGFSPGHLIDFLAGLLGFDPAGDDRGGAPPPPEEGVWLVGDLHNHVDPPDGGHAPVSPAETAALARAAGLDFVGINPHLWLRGRPMREREDIVAFGERWRALAASGEGPLLIPGYEVMVRSPGGARGHCLLLIRDPERALAFDGTQEEEWTRRVLAGPREERLWIPTHPAPREQVRIPFIPDWGGAWRQVEERLEGETTLGGRAHRLFASPWHATTDRRDDDPVDARLVRAALVERERRPIIEPDARLGQDWRRGRREPARRAEAPLPQGPIAEEEPIADALASPLGELFSAERADEKDAALAALGELLARELPGLRARAGPAELRVWLDVGRNGWIEAVASAGEGGGGRIALSLNAVPPAADGSWLPAFHEVPLDGLEAWTGLLYLAEKALGRGRDELAYRRVLRILDARILAERRRMTVTAGSDNHRDMVYPTMWVLAAERTAEAVFDAVREGRVVLRGPEATTFAARADGEGAWRPVGSAVRAEREVALRWRGDAELFIDGVSVGTHTGGYRHEIEPGSFHIYRIEIGPSCSAWIYANLP